MTNKETSEEAVVRLLEGLMTEVRAIKDETALRENLSVRLGLRSLGFAVNIDFLRVLCASEPRELWSNEPEVLRQISHDRRLCRMLQGSLLHRSLLTLLARGPIRRTVTRRFIVEMNHPTVAIENSLRDFGFECAVGAALETGLLKVKRIKSMEHYLQLGRQARRVLNTVVYRYLPGPFALPEGWRWFESGEDFRQLEDYPTFSGFHNVEEHHAAVRQGRMFLLRDNKGVGWMMWRMPVWP
ncbi:MAG: hypothetical protein IT582_06185 [Opitutaceae bacterium]|nr:hypothetical protein [Opitutaceae bacterium]